MREPRASAQAGFTLIETMISIVVLVFGLIGVINLFMMASTSNFTASQTTAAAGLASEQMDRLRTAPFNTLEVGGTVGSECPTCGQDDPYTAVDADDPGCPGTPDKHSCTQVVPGVGTIRVSWRVAEDGLSPNTKGIIVEALPISGLARNWSRVRLTTVRTCTKPAPTAGAAGDCAEILAP